MRKKIQRIIRWLEEAEAGFNELLDAAADCTELLQRLNEQLGKVEKLGGAVRSDIVQSEAEYKKFALAEISRMKDKKPLSPSEKALCLVAEFAVLASNNGLLRCDALIDVLYMISAGKKRTPPLKLSAYKQFFGLNLDFEPPKKA